MLPFVFPEGTQVQQMVTPRQARAEAYGKLPSGSPAHLAKTHTGTSDGLCLGLIQESDQRRAGSGCFENFGTYSIQS